MAYLNANIPPIYAKVRKEYLYDLDPNKKGELDCIIFAITSITGRAILFNILLPNGACYWRLPISAFFQKHLSRAEVPDMPIDALELWNCFSYYPSIYLKNISVRIFYSLIMVILQLSLIIVFCGTCLAILLITAGRTIKCRRHIGMSKTKTG